VRKISYINISKKYRPERMNLKIMTSKIGNSILNLARTFDE